MTDKQIGFNEAAASKATDQSRSSSSGSKPSGFNEAAASKATDPRPLSTMNFRLAGVLQ